MRYLKKNYLKKVVEIIEEWIKASKELEVDISNNYEKLL